MKTLLLAITGALLLSSGAAQAEKLYKWTDAEGNVHFTQTPPPEEAVEGKAVTPPPPANFGPSSKDKEAKAEEAEGAAKTSKTSNEEARNKDMQESCDRAKLNLDILLNNKKVIITDKEGNRVDATAAQREEAIARANKNVDLFCNRGGGAQGDSDSAPKPEASEEKQEKTQDNEPQT